METTQDKKSTTRRKSLPLKPNEKKALKEYVGSFNTTVEAAEALGVSRQVLNRVLMAWSGSPENISIILTKLGLAA